LFILAAKEAGRNTEAYYADVHAEANGGIRYAIPPYVLSPRSGEA